MSTFFCRSVFLELRRIGHHRRHIYLSMRRKSWFRLSFCQGLTTATLCWRVSPKTGWITCREYKTMQLVWSLADEGEAMQAFGFAQIAPLDANPSSDWVQDFHPVLSYLSDLLIISLPALRVVQTLVSRLFHASNSTSLESVLSYP